MSTQIKCKVGRPGCKGSITVTEPTAPDATYICRECSPKPEQDVFFQEFAFDKELSGDTEYEEFLQTEAEIEWEAREAYEQGLAKIKKKVRE